MKPTCVVTGANSGVGFEASRLLAGSGARVVLVCRDQTRGEEAVGRILAQVPDGDLNLELTDLASLKQVRDLGERLQRDHPKIDILVNNAGVYRAGLERTEDGFEKTLAVNHLAHFVLTNLVLPNLLAAGGRVINVSSEAHRRSSLGVASLEPALLGERPYKGWMTYSDSKLANVLFTAGLARRYRAEELVVCSVHPGVLATRIWNQNQNLLSKFMVLLKPLMGRGAVGGEAVAFLTKESGPSIHGRYFNKTRPVSPSPEGQDQKLAEALWELSRSLTTP